MTGAAPIPSDEADRLATLLSYDLLETPPDPRVDSIARLAADLFDMPTVLVSLVSADRQWFKARVNCWRTETPRDIAFCAHAILDPANVLVVEDAAKDARFADNPLVTEPEGIRFYAGAPILAPNGMPLGTLCLLDTKPRVLPLDARRRLRDLAENVSALLEMHRGTALLQRAATEDSLTGLANRRRFEAAAEKALATATEDCPVGFLLLDLDRFKPVNDRFGHSVGDRVLQQVATRLRAELRAEDVAARLGGDEFAVIVRNPAGAAGLGALATRLIEAVSTPCHVDAHVLRIGASVGIALAPADGAGTGALLRAADRALYHAKRSGRGCYRFSGADTVAPEAESALARNIRRMIENDSLALHWQPILNVRKGRINAQEALLRWSEPGPHAPTAPELIGMAESIGMLDHLESWVLTHACRRAQAWPGRESVAVNLSGYWFGEGQAATLVANALERTGFPAERLVIELTERTLVSNIETARQEMLLLRALGVRLSLDDFGTGFSSLAYLRSLPLDYVKLDRAFISDLVTDDRADTVARAIIQLAHALGMTICGEGVETKAQYDFCVAEGVDFIQGYLIGRPAPVPLFNAGFVPMPGASLAAIGGSPTRTRYSRRAGAAVSRMPAALSGPARE